MNTRSTTFAAGLLLSCMASASIAADLPKSVQHKDGSTMVLVPAGPFVMGSGEVKDETPPHQVQLPAFYSDQAYGWQIHSDSSASMTVYDPAGAQLPQILPRAFGFLRKGAKEVKIRLEARGEGFHMATLYDPAGQPAATVRHFVDFQDPGRYELELKAPVAGDTRGWSLELCNLKVLSIEGMLPYWAAGEAELFNPERPSAP